MPDVFILGFTKCATTSLYNQLMQHPDVSKTKRKEPHFHFAKVMGNHFAGPADNDTVSQMFVTDESQYQSLYEPGKLSIDGSAMSIEHPGVLQHINAQFPSAKYIIMLRDPIERAFSAYAHLVRDARETLSFREAVEQELAGARDRYLPIWRNLQSSRFVEATQYARQLLGDRLMVVSYRDYAKDNQRVMDVVAGFIGLCSITWQQDFANRSGVPHSKVLQKVLMRKSFAKSLFVAAFPEKFVTSMKRALMERNTGKKPELSNEDRAYFLQLLNDEKSKILPNTPDTQLLSALYQQ
ncbi:sulfotransferase [Aestuariibacter sp. GS-14]|uniref:sulfotransferase family protein n=2 Tax=Alteromonadaceae TaxID=72275 RepID=UPI0015E87169|nr:sulfotransferase [Aestuariibacter sp. GS-14]